MSDVGNVVCCFRGGINSPPDCHLQVLQKRWTLGFYRETNDRIGAPMLSMQVGAVRCSFNDCGGVYA